MCFTFDLPWAAHTLSEHYSSLQMQLCLIGNVKIFCSPSSIWLLLNGKSRAIEKVGIMKIMIIIKTLNVKNLGKIQIRLCNTHASLLLVSGYHPLIWSLWKGKKGSSVPKKKKINSPFKTISLLWQYSWFLPVHFEVPVFIIPCFGVLPVILQNHIF